jgi:hypothetical protein
MTITPHLTVQMPERTPRCACCGSTARGLAMAAIADSTWIWIHAGSSCERVYFGTTFAARTGKQLLVGERGAHFSHPLLQHRRGGHIIGFIRSNATGVATDSQGWWRLST